MPTAVITVWVYPVQEDELTDQGPHTIQIQAEWTICTDRSNPGGTEEWADVRYVDFGQQYRTVRSAEQQARKLAVQFAATPDKIEDAVWRKLIEDWDGVSVR